MNHATKYDIRKSPVVGAKEATAASPAVSKVCRLDAKTKRRRRDTKRQTAIRSGGNAANGFLKCTFLPKLKEDKPVETCSKSAKTERDFYQSLSELAKHYNIQPMQSNQYDYPYNIALAINDIQKQLKSKVRDWEEVKLIHDSRKTFITSTERYNTNTTLYYIPVVSLYRLLKNRKRTQAARLLLSVCSYLYRMAGIPYYREEDSFLYWQYEMLKEWVLSDEYTDETSNYLCDIEKAEWIGDRMEQKIRNVKNLNVFKQRLQKFNPTDGFENDCWQLATEAFDLYQHYPDASIFRNARPNGEAKEDDMENVLTMDKYISFCADGKGWLNENLEQCVNNELGEYGQIEEPTIVKHFKGNEMSNDTLEFENRLFSLLEELAYILNSF